ncbi:uncharacterized protein [Spinacia oleracea]|uniref:Reverse transcriptase domain-containing protein n=1 Tax=Spinacia oleracea TaxID=3562 RepID=A0ABM3RP52_SPIOL|nr:uncharacterized protein LOC130471353 [Spinacia oleracea]
MKDKHKINIIFVLYDSHDNKLVKPEDIQTKVIHFYSSLLGSCAAQLPMIDVPSIDDTKAPEIDELNDVFFKTTWPQLWFLIKVPNPSKVDDLRRIACCTVLYKIISKILTARLQRVVGGVVSECQAGFIPGRHISDNILLAT